MSFGFLPTSRPTAANYGQDLENQFPVKNPKLELDANDVNALKHDVAFLAGTAALAGVHVRGTTGAVLNYRGILAANVVVVRTGLGVYTLTLQAGAGFSLAVPRATPIATTNLRTVPELTSSSVMTVRGFNASTGAAADCDFYAEFF